VFTHDPTKIMCFGHKTRMKVDHSIKILNSAELNFSQIILWLFTKHFNHEYYMFGHAHIFFSFIVVLHLLKVLHNKWSSPHYVCIMRKEKIERFSEPKKEGCNILLNVLPMYLPFQLFDYLWQECMCFENLIKIYGSHHYCLTQSI
jgi:hypothetical protein